MTILRISRTSARVRVAVASLTAAVLLAGCGGLGPAVDPANDPAPEAPIEQDAGGNDGQDGVTSEDEANLATFCDRAIPLLTPVDRDFIGSDAQVQQFRDLRAVAPEELDAIIARLIDHYDLDVSPSDLESQSFDNFPEDVQEAALRLGDEVNARC